MDKESTYLLQKIDCNCNTCGFMERDFEKHKQSVDLHEKWQLDYFNTLKNKLLKSSKSWREKGDTKKSEAIRKEAGEMRFQFNRNSAVINFGRCTKLNKDVSFIPNICQLDTQKCFVHRSDKTKFLIK